jgi:hypothetical protein
VKVILATAVSLATLTSAVANGAPAGPPHRGANPADFPSAVWAEHGSRQIWLDTARVGYTFAPCVQDPPRSICGDPGPPPPLFLPSRSVRAGLTVAVGDVIRFHLPGLSVTRPVLRVGQRFNGLGKQIVPGRVFGLGTTDAPWWRVPKTARSGMATLTTSTGRYWFKLAVRF